MEPAMKRNVLILGASYGSLLGTKLLMTGHDVCLVCTAPTAELINREGTRVRFPVKGSELPVEVSSRELPGAVSAAAPAAVDPAGFDLVVLGFQETQYADPAVRGLMSRIARAGVPGLAIMNMTPPPFLRRIPGLDVGRLEACYSAPAAWEGFEPGRVSLASPDPQAFRPQGEPKNVLHVGLPTNFKAAPFADDTHTALLKQFDADIERARLHRGGLEIELPVKLKAHDSLFVPLAKWPMLIAGNYRCIRPESVVPIRAAVHDDPDATREVYEWVAALCMRSGARRSDLVPFEKYAQAALSLGKPSSVARALDGGAAHIDRVDALVRAIATGLGLDLPALNALVTLVDDRLEANRHGRPPSFMRSRG